MAHEPPFRFDSAARLLLLGLLWVFLTGGALLERAEVRW